MSKRQPRRKPIWLEKEAHKPTKADLPDVMELFDAQEATRIVLLIEEVLEVKGIMDEKVDDDEYDPKYHTARRYRELKEKLQEIQIEEGLDGLRYNNVVFSASLRDGKRSTDLKVLKEELVGKYGMRIEDVNAAVETATKQGESYWVKEVKVL